MQALGSHVRGRTLFLGLGTGLGAALVWDNNCLPLELGDLPYRDIAKSRIGSESRVSIAWARMPGAMKSAMLFPN